MYYVFFCFIFHTKAEVRTSQGHVCALGKNAAFGSAGSGRRASSALGDLGPAAHSQRRLSPLENGVGDSAQLLEGP